MYLCSLDKPCSLYLLRRCEQMACLNPVAEKKIKIKRATSRSAVLQIFGPNYTKISGRELKSSTTSSLNIKRKIQP